MSREGANVPDLCVGRAGPGTSCWVGRWLEAVGHLRPTTRSRWTRPVPGPSTDHVTWRVVSRGVNNSAAPEMIDDRLVSSRFRAWSCGRVVRGIVKV